MTLIDSHDSDPEPRQRPWPDAAAQQIHAALWAEAMRLFAARGKEDPVYVLLVATCAKLEKLGKRRKRHA